MKEKNPYRLQRSVLPARYHVEITPSLEKFVFRGKETIALQVLKPVTSITLHAAQLKITKAFVASGGRLLAGEIKYNKKFETATISFRDTVRPGIAELTVEFMGRLNDQMRGFYRTSYTIGSEKRWAAATQFEATDARRAFPCFDEPDMKARFNIVLNIPENLVALSNTSVAQSVSVGDGMIRVSFLETKLLPTYLVAFAVGDFESIAAKDKNGVSLRVWTTPGKKDQGKFALDFGVKALEYFTEWYRVPYPWEKLDMLALPDFAAGAMENAGLITYRETALLVHPKNSSVATKRGVAETIAHELAHQWFGDLVTMKWWTHLWLNEGFASYMGPKAVAEIFPEWNVWTEFVAGDMLSALHDDALRNTHAIEIPVKNPAEISEIFDGISYCKGASVNRMLDLALGKSFRDGLELYLHRHKYANAATDDLWAALHEVSGRPVEEIMGSYTRQPGYPVLFAGTELKDKKLSLVLTQKRFYVDGKNNRCNPRWKVPVQILFSTRGSRHEQFTYLDRTAVTLPLPADYDWVKINSGQGGFYRVAYSAELGEKLLRAINAGELDVLDRLGMIDDAFALARAGYAKGSHVLALLSLHKFENDLSVWRTITQNFNSFSGLFWDEVPDDKLNLFGRDMYALIAVKKGWDAAETDSDTDRMLRAIALMNYGFYGDEPTITEARLRFVKFLKTGELDPNLRGTIYSLVARSGGDEELQNLMNIYNSTDMHEEKERVMRALSMFTKSEILKKVLSLSLSKTVRLQDAPFIVMAVAQNPAGRNLAWEFLKDNWPRIRKLWGSGGMSYLAHVIEYTTGGFKTSEQLSDVRAFFKEHKAPGTERAVKQSLEMIGSNTLYIERSRDDVKNWLNNFNDRPRH